MDKEIFIHLGLFIAKCLLSRPSGRFLFVLSIYKENRFGKEADPDHKWSNGDSLQIGYDFDDLPPKAGYSVSLTTALRKNSLHCRHQT